MLGTNRLGVTVICNNVLAKVDGGKLPDELAPKLHLFYAFRQIDIQDSLPNYLDGASGEKHE